MKPSVPYDLYEKAVQSPATHAELFAWMHKEVTGKAARRLREDFCGTFQISCAWARAHPKNTVVGVDLDPDPIRYGRETHLPKLNAEQRSRVDIVLGDVLKAKSEPADIIAACNYSFYIFKTRALLLKYFANTLVNLKKGGLLVLEMGGGSGFIETTTDQTVIKRRGKKPYIYLWDQQAYEPIQSNGKYAIHFKQKGVAKPIMNAFTYDWRIWGITEVREAMIDAGFRKTVVYWENDHKGKPTGEYSRTEVGDNSYSWCAYIIGIK